MTESLTLGTGAGFAGDRIEPAVKLAESGRLNYLVFECLAERTIAKAQERRLDDSKKGYTPLLRERMESVLPHTSATGTIIVTNMGAANPKAAQDVVVQTADKLGLSGLNVASVTGSDVLDNFDAFHQQTSDGESVDRYQSDAVSANAYLGVEGICEALERDADVVVTGRVADPSLFLAPILHEFDWPMSPEDPPTVLGQGIACGHLMECAGQVTGGYFADPGYKHVEELDQLGFPIAEVSDDGDLVITKLPDTGGAVTIRTCKEQILYEVHDPNSYVTPDAVADFSRISLEKAGNDRVRVKNADVRARPEQFKVNIGYRDAVLGEGQISYAGPGAAERARLAGEVVRRRLEERGVELMDERTDLLGVNALHEGVGRDRANPYEVRLRVAGKCETQSDAEAIGREVTQLYTNGPAGGSGVTTTTRPLLGIVSTLIDRDEVTPVVQTEEVS